MEPRIQYAQTKDNMCIVRTIAGVLLVALLASGCAGVSTEKMPPGTEDPAATPPGAANEGAGSAESGTEGTGDESSSKPRSTLDDIGLGGGTYVAILGVPVKSLPASSEVAILAKVSRIGPAFLNTPSGEWDPPAGASAQELHDLYSRLFPYTPIHLEVLELLGARPQSTIDVSVGDQLTLTLSGGAKRFTFSVEEARAIGITVIVDEGAPPLPDGSVENEVTPTGPVTQTVFMSPAVRLTEGDVVIVFLSQGTIDLYPGGVPKDVVVSLHATGFAIYRQASPNADLFVNALTAYEVIPEDLMLEDLMGLSKEVSGGELRAAAAALKDQSGPVQPARLGALPN